MYLLKSIDYYFIVVYDVPSNDKIVFALELFGLVRPLIVFHKKCLYLGR